jgi:hypothetical protein
MQPSLVGKAEELQALGAEPQRENLQKEGLGGGKERGNNLGGGGGGAARGRQSPGRAADSKVA